MIRHSFLRRAVLSLGLVCATSILAGCEWSGSLLSGEPPAWSARTGVPGIEGRTVWQGTQSGITEAAQLMARSPGEWGNLWQRIGEPPPGELPQGTMAVAVFAGLRNTGGFTVEIASPIQERAGETVTVTRVVVPFTIKAPPADAMVSQAQTTPWAVRLIEAYPGRVEFLQQ